jgi:hypothetical protein
VTRSLLATRSGSAGRESGPPPGNSHVHLPPNFSAFEDVASVVERAREEGVVAVGSSNYFDFRVYRRFADAAAAAGVVALHGTEIIALQEDLQADGVLVNDPANPGRTYICGKAIAAYDAPGPAATSLMATIRRTSEERMAEMATRLADCAHDAGLTEVPTIQGIVDDVAASNAVPADWVSLQERHLARALQEAVHSQSQPEQRGVLLATLLRGPVDPGVAEDPIALQDAIRSRLMKAGRPAFVPEAAISFDEAYRLVLELDGIPCYPTLADGADPVCPFEDPPEALAEALLGREVYLAELIPTRNAPDVVDRYVAAFRGAGILVLAGTEHNTQRMIPLVPACRGGVALSAPARTAFWEATCVIAAHQHLRTAGKPGYVDARGRLASGFADGEARIRWFRELGEQVISAAQGTGALA